MVRAVILLGPDPFDLSDKVGGLMSEIAILPCATIASASLAALKDDGAGRAEIGLLGCLDAVLQQLATLLAVNALCNAILLPRRTIHNTQASLCKILVADLGGACEVLTLKKVPQLLLSGAGAEVVVLAGANRIEGVLNTELLDVAGALLLAVHTVRAVLVVLRVLVDGADVGHGETSLCVDSVENLVESCFACECVRTSRHDCQCDIDSLGAERIVESRGCFRCGEGRLRSWFEHRVGGTGQDGSETA